MTKHSRRAVSAPELLRQLIPVMTLALAALLPAAASASALKKSAPAVIHDVAYAPSSGSDGDRLLLDLYLPGETPRPAPIVIFTHGSAWLEDNGRLDADVLAAHLRPRGYAVAGVAVRSSAATHFPGQLHDIKAAIRWLRANAGKYGLDPSHIGVVGESSGGWAAAMAAVTGDVPELEGAEGVRNGSSAVQAAVAFYPPTDFLQMDAWALAPCDPKVGLAPGFCHNSAESPESRLIGCALPSCPDKVEVANPIRYISAGDPPVLILHGGADDLVPHAQGELLYQALNKACHTAYFVSLPVAPHGFWRDLLEKPSGISYGATIRSTVAKGCAVTPPKPVVLTWAVVDDFLDANLRERH